MVLSYNPKQKEYFYTAATEEQKKRAIDVGLTLSTSVRGPAGEFIYYTDVPYAALPFWSEADARAKQQLQPLYRDYCDSWATSTSYVAPCPSNVAYFPYQNAGIEYGIKHHNVLIGDEPGLGKSGQAVGIANATEAERVLIVCPATIRLNWQREVRKWSILPRVKTYPILKSAHGVSPDANYVIVSYDLTRNKTLHEVLYSMEWDVLVLDEAHFLKETDAQRTRAIFGGGLQAPFAHQWLAARAKRIVALTGTPLPNRPRECYTLARALNAEAIDWMSYDDFAYRFNPSARMETDEGKIVSREEKGRLPELQARLRSNFMVRRLKSEVLKDLPDKRYEMTYIEETGEIREVLQKESFIKFNINEFLSNPYDIEIWGQISTVRREMGEAKVPRIVEHCKFLLDIQEMPKIVLFNHHRSVMDRIKAMLEEKYGIVEVRGGMSAIAKQKAVDQFVNDPKIRIFSGQMEAAGFGIDGLQQVAQWVVFGEPAWVPGVNEQCIDRCHRIGQHSNVVAQFLVVEGSLDEKVLASVLEKAHTIHGSLDAVPFMTT